MSETLYEILVRVARTYGFRARGPLETVHQYREALIAFTEHKDYAAAHEVRVGCAQAEWTPDHVMDFSNRLRGRPRSQHLARVPNETIIMEGGALAVVTDAALLADTHIALERYTAMRRAAPAKDLMAILTVALLDARLLILPVSRVDRISTMKAFARDMPVFGFALVFDAFMHRINEVTKVATKRDVLLQHVISRTCRVTRSRPYEVRQGRAFFDNPPPPDFTALDLNAGGWRVADDPYADVFVSVPPPTGPPS